MNLLRRRQLDRALLTGTAGTRRDARLTEIQYRITSLPYRIRRGGRQSAGSWHPHRLGICVIDPGARRSSSAVRRRVNRRRPNVLDVGDSRCSREYRRSGGVEKHPH